MQPERPQSLKVAAMNAATPASGVALLLGGYRLNASYPVTAGGRMGRCAHLAFNALLRSSQKPFLVSNARPRKYESQSGVLQPVVQKRAASRRVK